MATPEDATYSVDKKSELGLSGSNDADDSKNETTFQRSAGNDKEDSDVEVCRNFLNNRCSRGAFCKFRHPSPDGSKSHERNRSRSPNSNAREDHPSVCRDFIRNMCRRGKDCRYYHPPEKDVKRSWFTCCLDFQNGKCTRHDCRYFHITRGDEAAFQETGDIPLHIIDQAFQMVVSLESDSKSARPVCKDYIKGLCDSKTCRYRHVSRQEYEDEIYKSLYQELVQLVGCDPRKGAGPPPLPYSSLGNRGSHDMGRGDRRLGPTPSFSSFGGSGGFLNRNPYSYDQYASPMRGRSDFPPRSASPPVTPYLRDAPSFSDSEDLRRECAQLRNDLYRLKRDKDEEILLLQRKFDHARYQTNPYDTATDAHDTNEQLKIDLDKINLRNDELLRELKACQNWEQIYNDAKIKLQNVQRELQDDQEKLRLKESEFNVLTGKTQSFERYKSFIEEQVFKLQSQLLVVENELSQSWGGGPPPMPNQREAWAYLKSLISMLTTLPDDPEPAIGYTSVTPSYDSSYGARTSFKESRGSWNGNYSSGGAGGGSGTYKQPPQAVPQTRGRIEGPSWERS